MTNITPALLALIAAASLLTACARHSPQYSDSAAAQTHPTAPQSNTSEAHEQGVFHHARAQSRLQQADYNNAVADMDKAQTLINPQLLHLYSHTIRDVYFHSAIAYYDAGEYDHAIILFDKAIAVAPSPSQHPASYYHRGLSHYRKGNHRRAIADFDKIIHLEQDYPDAALYRRLAHNKIATPSEN